MSDKRPDDDDLLSAWIAACCIAGVLALVLIVVGVRAASAAAVLDIGGQKIIVMTGDDFIAAMRAKDAEINTLRDKLDARTKIECNLV